MTDRSIIEIVNDNDGFIVNCWRAIKANPEAVWAHTYWPCAELDFFARGKWLREQSPHLADRLREDMDYYDARIAGMWIWGINLSLSLRWPRDSSRTLPNPFCNRGVTSYSSSEKLHLLSKRLRRTRIVMGDWKRALFPLAKGKVKSRLAVLLDPPYVHERRDKTLYSDDNPHVAIEAYHWAIANPNIRIAYCGYESDQTPFPSDWECYKWKAMGGFSNCSKKKLRYANRYRERIWFSPACIKPKEDQLYE